MLWHQDTKLFYDIVPSTTMGTDNWEIDHSTKLCSWPSTTEAFEHNFRRAHNDVALWYIALSGDPTALNSTWLGNRLHQQTPYPTDNG